MWWANADECELREHEVHTCRSREDTVSFGSEATSSDECSALSSARLLSAPPTMKLAGPLPT